MPRLEADAAGHLGYWHPRSGSDDVRQLALVPGIEMDYDHERRIDIVGQALEKLLQSVDAPRGRPDAYGREPLISLRICRLWIHGRLIIVGAPFTNRHRETFPS
jgi:hypothetical protein